MTRRDFLRLRVGEGRAADVEARPVRQAHAGGAIPLRDLYLRAMQAGVDPATMTPEELVGRFGSEATSNDAHGG